MDSDEEWEEEEPGESLSHSEGVSDTTSLLLHSTTEAMLHTSEKSHQN